MSDGEEFNFVFDDDDDDDAAAADDGAAAGGFRDAYAMDRDDEYGGFRALQQHQHQLPPPTLSGDQLVPFQVVQGRNPDVVRPESAVTDNLYYYKQLAVLVGMYGQVTRGLPPPLFDAKRQCLVTRPLAFDF